MRARRSQRADVEGLGADRRLQRRIVDLGIVGQRDQPGARIQRDAAQGLVGPFADDAFAGKPGFAGEALPRIDQQRIESRKPRHRQQGLRDVDGADGDEARRGIVDGDERRPVILESRSVEAQALLVTGPLQARRHVDPGDAGDRNPRRPGLDKLRQHGGGQRGSDRLDQDADPAAAGEPRSEGVAVADAVFQHLRPALGNGVERLRDHRALDAAAGDGPLDLPGARDRELAADAARRASPCLDHRGEGGPPAVEMPRNRLFGDVVEAVHAVPPGAEYRLRRARPQGAPRFWNRTARRCRGKPWPSASP